MTKPIKKRYGDYVRLFTAMALCSTCCCLVNISWAYDAPRLVLNDGHARSVNAVAYSPDGRTLLSGSGDKTLRLWDASTGQEIHRMEGHIGWVHAVAYSPDGRTLVSGSSDHTLRLWDAVTGKELRRIQGHAGRVSAVAVSPDGRTLLSGSFDRTLRLWDAATGRELRRIQGHTESVSAVAYSPDGRTLLSGSADKTLRLWDAATGRALRRMQGDAGWVSAVAYSPDGRTLLSGGDGTLRLWDAATGKESWRMQVGSGPIDAVTYSPDGRTLLSGSLDGTLRVWDAATGKELRRIQAHNDEVNAVAYSPDGRTLLSGGGDKTLRLWDASTGQEIRHLQGQGTSVRAVAFGPGGRTLLTGSEDKILRRWDAATGKEVHRMQGHTGGVSSVAFSPDGRTLLSGGDDNTLRLWDAATGTELRRMQVHTRWVQAVAYSPDGRTLLSRSDDNALSLWEAATGTELRRMQGHAGGVSSVTFSPDGYTLLSGGGDRTLRLWDAGTGKEMRRIHGHTAPVKAIAYGPDGRTLLSGSEDTILRLWDAATGKELRHMRGHANWVNAVAYSPDGRTLLSGSADKTLRLWDTATGKEIRHMRGHSDWVRAVAYSPDGRTLLSGGDDNTLRLWEATTGRELASLVSFDDGSWAVTEPGGRYDSSDNGENPNLHWVVGMTPVGIEQLKDRYYDPGLLAKIMGFNTEPLRTVPAFGEALTKLPPSVSLQATAHKQVSLHVTDEGGGIGRIRVRLNGKELYADARTLTPKGSTSADDKVGKGKRLTLSIPVDDARLLSGNNTLDAFAFNEDNHIQSRLASVTLRGPEASARTPQPVEGGMLGALGAAAEPPTLFVIAVGVSKYAADAGKLDLAFSGKDAVDFSQGLLIAGKRLFGVGQVKLRLLTDSDTKALQAMTSAGHTVNVQTPGRNEVTQAFAAVAKEAKASDIVVVFLGGHGVMTPGAGLDTGDYHYLLKDARSADLTDPAVRKLWAVSGAELTEWTKAIKANKQVLVLDTCAAGGAVEKLVQQRTLPGSHTIALERLKDRTGFHILAGAAADKVSYEASRYGQGLLTHALLTGLRGAALRDNEYADVSKLFQYAVDQVPELAKGVGGIQRPMIASPKGSSFDIGRLTADDKKLVPVALVKPLILRGEIQGDDFRDPIKLGLRFNAKLRELNYAATRGKFVFVDADEHPDGWKLRARYKKLGNGWEVNGILFKGDEERNKVSVTLPADDSQQIEALLLVVQKRMDE